MNQENTSTQFSKPVQLYAPDGSVFNLPAHVTLDTYTRKGYKLEPDAEWHEAEKELEAANKAALKKQEEAEERERLAAEIKAESEAKIAALYEEAEED